MLVLAADKLTGLFEFWHILDHLVKCVRSSCADLHLQGHLDMYRYTETCTEYSPTLCIDCK